MLTSWLTLTALLTGSEITGQAASAQEVVTFAPVCSIKSRPESEITLPCGDGETAGEVQYWHTPFGGFQTPGQQGGPEPVVLHADGSLVIPSSSLFHSGLYYCLLRGGDGTTLWQYQLHVHPTNQKLREDKERSRCAAVRFRRRSGPAEPAGVSDQTFAGAVAASVLLTFVVGFGAGALSRTHILRCFGSITIRINPRQTDMPDHGSQVTMTSKASPYINQAFVSENDSVTMERTTLSNQSPPAKPQRSFRLQQDEEAAAYLEKCDHMEEGESDEGEIKADNEGNKSEIDEEKHHGDKDGENTEGRTDESLENTGGLKENVSEEDDEEIQREKTTNTVTDKIKETETCEDLETENEGSRKQEDLRGDETASPSSAPSRGRHSRVIRLYQYDEDGQRFPHLPEPTSEDLSPAPKLKQRSISLTRLSTIMAAASAGPLSTTASEEKLQFHMEI